MRKLLLGFIILGTSLLGQARLMQSWSYQELYDQADLVVVAKPESTQPTDEHFILPNIAPDVHVVGLSTHFYIKLVMKGDKTMKALVLHHCRLANPGELMMNGPELAEFDPKGFSNYLLFLHREADGRYAPVSGQTDPILFSILKMAGAAR